MIDNRYKIVSASEYYRPILEVYPELNRFRFEPEENIKCESIPSENYGGSIELNTMSDLRRLMSVVGERLILEDVDRSPYDIPEHIITIYDGCIE